ncbi:site-specific integrase [Vibrio diabolicus]|uniref:site-specific integrase n=1 Tax=Vibrio diabolicus TaxID=50719 RepID=UPI00211AC7F6|nr:site-specific integrase [Vibrio diabolicus]
MARRRFDSSRLFYSKARIVYINQFREGHAVYSEENDKLEGGWVWIKGNGFWPKMPVILNGDGVPWDLGNLYLMCLLDNSIHVKLDTIQDRAKSLCFYLKFIEDENLDLLNFPAQVRKRPTYRFRYKLQEFIDLGMASSTARKHIGHIVAFYQGLLHYSLVDKHLLSERPFRIFKKNVRVLSNEGLSRFKEVQTTDISIRQTRSSNVPRRIIDGGILRPLSMEEQDAIIWGFEQRYCSIETELMMLIMLSTGSRVQSTCTLRVAHIIDAYKELKKSGKSWVFIHSHKSRYSIDTKQSKPHNFRFPKILIERIYTYILSPNYIKRASSSYFGHTDENYIFLTDQSTPFYTSQSEIFKRQEDVNSMESKPFKQRNGNSLRANIRNFIARLRVDIPTIEDFTAHDLRATFGMNLVRRLARDPGKRFTTTHMELAVKTALNHSDIRTSRRYVNFDEIVANQNYLNQVYEEFVLDGYKVTEAIYGDEGI